MLFGAHMSTSGGVWKALERGDAVGCDSIQIFVKNNMQWFGRPLGPSDIARFVNARRESRAKVVFAHAGYLINLAAPPSPNRDKSLQSLVQEIELATQLDLPFLVLHPGAHLGGGEDAGICQLIAGLNEVLRATKQSRVRVALENTAGQGTCLGADLQHLGRIYEGIDNPSRLGVCLDTAHFFAAGYDIGTLKGWNGAIEELDNLVGTDEIIAFHINDSKSGPGSRVDRHAGIGQGKIGRVGFRHIVNDPRFKSHPSCLETPKSPDLHEDVENLALLRSLMKGPSSRRPRTGSRRRKPPH